MITLKNPDQLAKMRSAGHLLYDVIQRLREAVKPGETTAALDAYAEEMIRRNNAIPSSLNYCGYPKSICASIDDEVVHGIPSDDIELKEGQIISLDVTLLLDGWQADSALTVPVGQISAEKADLIRVTEESFWMGARQALCDHHVGDISHAVQRHAEAHGYGVVRDLTGHGIGRKMHEDPAVPNFGEEGHGTKLRPGMTITIEPMIAMGTWRVHELANDWTFVTNDHQPASHYEHTLAIRRDGLPEILTLPDGGWKGEPV